MDESDEAFRAVADTVPVMLWRAGTDRRRDFFNKSWLRFTGRTIEQELGMGWADGVHPEDCARCLETYEGAFGTRQPFRMQYRLRHRDGLYRWIDDTGTPRLAGDGSFIGYLGSCVDVHDHRAAAEQLRSALAEKTKLLAEKTALLHEIRHRVRNNLQLVLSLIAIHSGGASEPQTREVLQNISRKILAIAAVQEQLSAASNFRRVDFGRYLHEQRLFFKDRSAVLKIDAVGVQIPLQRVTPLALITSELISNCYQHAFRDGRPGRIDVTLRLRDGHGGRIVVSDNGVGCLPQTIEETTGTGWKIVRALAQQAQATLKIEPVNGTRITIDFPLEDRGEDEAPRG